LLQIWRSKPHQTQSVKPAQSPEAQGNTEQEHSSHPHPKPQERLVREFLTGHKTTLLSSNVFNYTAEIPQPLRLQVSEAGR